MKLNVIVQANGKEMDISGIEQEVKDRVKDAGIKLNKVDDAKAYVNLNEGKTYVVIETEGKEIQL